MIQAIVTDANDSTSSADDSATVTVMNLDPGINSFDGGNAQVPGVIDIGEDVVINATFSDVGIEDEFTFEVDWGDGNITSDATVTFDQAQRNGTIVARHAYGAAGVFFVTATLMDDDLGTSETFTTKAIIGNTSSVVDFSQATYQVNEDGTAVGAAIELVRTGNLSGSSTIEVLLENGTANGVSPFVAGNASEHDFDLTSIVVSFEANQDRKTVLIPINDDRFDEEDLETFTLSLANPQGTFVGCSQFEASVDIVDNDVAGVTILQSGNSTTVVEGGTTDTFIVRLDTIPTEPVTMTIDPDIQLNLDTVGGVAIVLTFAADATALLGQTVTVTAVDDNVDEGDHTGTIAFDLLSSDSRYRTGFAAFSLSSLIVEILEEEPVVLEGDYNGNGLVEQGDLDLVLLNWGTDTSVTTPAGWTNDLPDSRIDQNELDRVLLNWGNRLPAPIPAIIKPQKIFEIDEFVVVPKQIRKQGKSMFGIERRL